MNEPQSHLHTEAACAPAAWEPLPRAARTLYRLNAMLMATLPMLAPFFVAVVGANYRFDAPVAVVLALIAALAVLGWWLGGLRHRRTRYRFDAEGLRLRRGLCWRSETLVPRNRVQHLDLERGPVERRLGLATLVLHTAGTRFNVIRVIGLEAARARQLRDALVDHDAGADDDAV